MPEANNQLAKVNGFEQPAQGTNPYALEKNLYEYSENHHLVDALSYIDTDYNSADVSQEVKKLIEDEMKTFQPRDYLAQLPDISSKVFQSDILKSEMARCNSNQPLERLDLKMYTELKPPEDPQGGPSKNPDDWKKAIRLAQTSLEHSNARTMNMELMQKFGKNLWTHAVVETIKMEKEAQDKLQKLKKEEESINKKRKLDQITCANTLRSLNQEYAQYQENNVEVEEAVAELEVEIELLKRQCKERGVLPKKFADEEEKDRVAAESAAANQDVDMN